MIHKGTYDGTIYHNPANRFCIISVKTADKEVPLEARSTRRYRDHLIRFVATGYELPRTDAVELELDGEWKQGKYGMQFQVEQWRQIVPRTKSGVEGYLASGLMQMLFHYTQLCPFVPDLQTETDAVFTARNLPLLAGCENWPQVRTSVLTTDMDWAQLKESLSISDEFVKQNQNCITDFLLRGGSSLVTPLYNYLQGNDAAIEALRRIVQAELMGRFYVLKYFADDLHREINHPISEQQETAWQKNLALERGKFIAEEADDFYHTIQIGELPYGTCLSYRTGSQRECLLAAFDSNKKIILIRKGDEIVARACIRLTKGAFQKPTELMLSFADLAGENTTESGRIVSEKLVLFLERIYTTGINDDEQQVVMEMAVVLATQKAAELGAVSVLARRYVNCYARDQYVSSPFYVYISKSKNGQQYLDSLGGAATTSRKEKYVEGAFLVERAALHTAGVLPEKEE